MVDAHDDDVAGLLDEMQRSRAEVLSREDILAAVRSPYDDEYPLTSWRTAHLGV